MLECSSSNTASPTASARSIEYPRVSHASARLTRSGVCSNPSRPASLTGPLCRDPMLHPHRRVRARIWIASDVTGREHAGRARAQLGVHTDSSIDSQAGTLGEPDVRAHAHSDDDKPRRDSLAILEHDG